MGGAFSGKPEGATFVVGLNTFQITYAGGSGNDVVLLVTGAPVVWDGGAGNFDWGNPLNWNGDVLPISTSDVIIQDLLGTPTITSTGSVSIRNLDIAENVRVAGGSFSLAQLAGAGTLTVENGVSLNTTGNLLTQGNLTVVAGGALAVNGAYTQTIGTTSLDGDLSATSGVSLQGGSFVGSGDIVGNFNNTGGTLAPGHSPGIMTVTGNYAQSGGSLNIEIQGTAPNTPDFDQLRVLGTVALGGTLNVSFLSSFKPATGATFKIIDNDNTDAVTGTFSGLPQGANLVVGSTVFSISYSGGDGNDVVLTATAVGTWIGGSGDWNTPANWVGSVLPTATDHVVLPAGVTVTHSSGTHTVASITSSGSLALSGGSLTVNGNLSFQGTFTLSGGATLRNATVTGGAGALFQVASTSGTLDGVTLGVNTTLRQGSVGSGNQVTVLNSLTLANNITLRLERTTNSAGNNLDVGLNFNGGAQTLGGSGVVELFSAGAFSQGIGNPVEENDVRVRPTGVGASLTIGAGILVRNASGSDFTTLGNPALPLILEGRVSAQSSTLRVTGLTVSNAGTLESLAGTLQVLNLTGNVNGTSITNGNLDLNGTYRFNQPVSVPGGSLTLRGNWDNETTIHQTGGTINLWDTFTVADLGTFTGTAGTVNINGTLDDPGATLNINAARTWQVNGGTVKGLTIQGDAAALFQVTSSSGTLDGVTLGVNTTLRQGSVGAGNQVSVLNNLTLANNVTLRLERTTNSAGNNLDVGLNFNGGAQTLGGSGVVELFSAGTRARGSAMLSRKTTCAYGPRVAA